MGLADDYRKILAIIAGTLCLIIALFLPAKYALGFSIRCVGNSVWTSINWIFLGLSIVFLWGEIALLAKSVGQAASNVITRKSK